MEHTQTEDAPWRSVPLTLKQIYDKLQEDKDLKTPCKDKLTPSIVREYEVEEDDLKKRKDPTLADCCAINYYKPKEKFPRLVNEICLRLYEKFVDPLLNSVSSNCIPEANEHFTAKVGENGKLNAQQTQKVRNIYHKFP